MSEISSRLLTFRNRFQKSQKEMAELLGIPFRTLQDCERGKTLPSATTLIAYSKLGADLNWILSDQDSQKTEPLQDEWASNFEPIPWFAPDDIRDSYDISDQDRRATAKIAMSHDQIKLLIPKWKPKAFRPFPLASTSIGKPSSLVLFDTEQTNPTETPADFIIADERFRKVTLQRIMADMTVQLDGDKVSRFDSNARHIGKVIDLHLIH